MVSEKTIQQWRRRTDDLLSQREVYAKTRQRESKEKARLETELEHVEEARGIVQAVSQAIQQIVHDRVAKIVTDCLEAVFDDPYEFRIIFDRKRGKTEARIIFCRDGVELDDPLNQVGGGIIDVAAFALRLACLMISRPARRRLLILDEPMKYVRGEVYRRRVAEMLQRLSKELEVQILLNTDVPTFRLGTVVEMG